ncbi:MAG: DUF3105 domain-containing protein [Candidatus Daviesbacteria bacterium]|nr:DUF3105 domain-containing protein [Candidatus Daviesbacteria bacterium]
MTKKLGIILTAIFVGMALLVWLFIASMKPLPGEKLLQDGRNHVDEGSKVDYKFNPPTSGDHYASWITKGFYEDPRADGNLVHSMEHGYIIVWYDCEKKVSHQWSVISEVYAHEDATPSATTSGGSGMTQGSTGVATMHLEDMPKAFSDGSCETVKTQLKDLYQKDQHKLIIMPRVGMDSPIILTAWGRAEKLNSVDQGKIKEFINAFRDQGPEATVEP